MNTKILNGEEIIRAALYQLVFAASDYGRPYPWTTTMTDGAGVEHMRLIQRGPWPQQPEAVKDTPPNLLAPMPMTFVLADAAGGSIVCTADKNGDLEFVMDSGGPTS